MNTIIGQNKLVEKLKSYSFNKMPKTLLFIGDKGSGRHYISKCFANYLMVDLVELTAQTTAEQLIELYQATTQKICLLDLSTITEKQQNKYLKFIEEPAANIRIILIAESEVGILPTILNRCIKYTLEDYSIDQLKQFSWAIQLENPLIYELCNTPGQLLEASSIENLDAMQQACTNLILNLPKISYLDLFSYNLKINYSDEFKKFDFRLFLKLLTKTAYQKYIENKSKILFDIYRYLVNRNQQLFNKSVAKEAFMITILDELWRLAH